MAGGGVTLPQEPRKGAAARNMAVFIDADNLCDATALDHVLTDVRQRADRVLYKRAYGRVDSLKAIESVLWRHGVRPVSNMIVNKVTTDSALVIDAVEAICTQDIDTVAICSGDADFVPLATWARERGCRVLCFSLTNKIFANPESFYDDVILLEVVDKSQAADGLSGQALAPALISAQEAPEVCAVERLAAGSIPAPGGVGVAAEPSAKQFSGPELVEQVLQALPSLRNGKAQHLSQVVATLRQRGVLGKTVKTTVWFAQLGGSFVLQPSSQPNQITYIAGASAKQAGGEAGRAAADVPGGAASPEMVQRVLKAVPQLRHAPQMLNEVVPVLRQKTILGKAAKSTAFFRQFPLHFKLSPQGQPTQIAYIAARISQPGAQSAQPQPAHGPAA